MKLQRQTAVLLGLVSIGVAFGCSSGGGGGGGGASTAFVTSGSTAAQTTSSSTGVVTSSVAPVVTAAPVVASPSRFVYCADSGTDSITPFTIDAKTGKLTAGTAVSTGAGSGPFGLTADSKGRFLFTSEFSDMAAFAIDPKTGALTPIVGSSVTVGQAPWTCWIDPTDSFVLVNDLIDDSLRSYKVGPTGALTDAGTVTLTGSGGGDVAFSPDGKFAYVAAYTNGGVFAVAVEAGTGNLAQVDMQLAGQGASVICVDHAGKFVYVGNTTDATISIFSRDAATGKLTPVGKPVACAGAPGALTLDAAGKNLYVPCDSSGSSAGNVVQAFTVDPATGLLTASTAPNAPTGDTPYNFVIDASGSFAFTSDFLSDAVDAFTIDPKTGAITTNGTPTTAGAGAMPYGIAIVK